MLYVSVKNLSRLSKNIYSVIHKLSFPFDLRADPDPDKASSLEFFFSIFLLFFF